MTTSPKITKIKELQRCPEFIEGKSLRLSKDFLRFGTELRISPALQHSSQALYNLRHGKLLDPYVLHRIPRRMEMPSSDVIPIYPPGPALIPDQSKSHRPRLLIEVEFQKQLRSYVSSPLDDRTF